VSTSECRREREILDAVRLERWSEDLRGHAAGCAVCADLATVAAALCIEHEEAMRQAPLPTAAQVWWRASVRARAEAAARAARPITLWQAVAAACGAGLSAALATLVWPRLQQPFQSIAAALSPDDALLGGTMLSPAVQQMLLPLGVMTMAIIVVTPLVLYVSLSDK
jgi:hypothetical protein